MKTLAAQRTDSIALNRPLELLIDREFLSRIFIFLILYITYSLSTIAMTPDASAKTVNCDFEVCEDNLLGSGSFEYCHDSWDFGSTTGYNYGTTYAMHGTYNFFIAPYNTSDTYAELSQMVSATPENEYTLSFYAGVHEAIHDQYVYLQFIDGSSNILDQSSVEINYDVTNTYDLQAYSLTGTAPSGTENVRVLGSVTKASGYSYAYLKLDGMCLTESEAECVELPSTDGCVSTNELYGFNFDSSEEGFTYQDDAFYSTSQPGYASGQRISSGGYQGGAIQVELGGLDSYDILNMSAAWEYTFNLSEASDVHISFQYEMDADDEYESDEHSEVLVSVDNVFYGSGGNDYIERIYGGGATGWTYYSVSLGTLSAGNHTLKLGGFNNKKTSSRENTLITFDDVKISEITDVSDFSWANSITWNGSSVQSTYRLKGTGTLYLEMDLPDDFHAGPITVDITDFYTWDGYEGREDITTQPYEQLRLDFYKDGNLVHQTGFTPDLEDGVCFADWRGSMGTFNAINGVDQVVIVHPEFDDSSLATSNSIIPVSLCLNYEINSSLPVSWLDFDAEWVGKNASLTWSTASEENASHFDVQRSIDGIQFETLGSVAAMGNTQDISSYTFMDKAALDKLSIYYYRLKQVDLDGKSTYSKIISLETVEGLTVSNLLDVYPNPAYGQVNLSLRQATDIQGVSILNALGQRVPVEVSVNRDQARVNLENLLPGHYYVRVETIYEQYTQSLFISK
ncbi:MAG: T9SS type A sorting domain-containing protein [Bacteroidota bacterium]